MKNTAKEWDEVRSAFAASIMVDTQLTSLAQNLDGPDWPVAGETPATYVDLTFAEMKTWLAGQGLSAEYGDVLIKIFRDTLEFDNPFGEMVEQNEAAAQRDNQLLKNMARLGITENFPVGLANLSPDTLEFCKSENLETLGTLAVFAQNMSQNVIVGGDFRKMLNALSHIDEESIAEVLPFRPGSTGLHLVETLAHATRAGDPEVRASWAIACFPEEFAAIKASAGDRHAFAQQFAVLGNPALESEAAELLRPHLKIPIVRRTAEGKPKGMFSRLFGG